MGVAASLPECAHRALAIRRSAKSAELGVLLCAETGPTELNSYQQKLRRGPVMGINFRLQGASLNFLQKSDLGH